MNARQPFLGLTASPGADAERWANEQDRREATTEQLKARALSMLMQDLVGLTPTGWFKKLPCSGWSMDEILLDALDSDSDIISCYAELLTCDHPLAEKLRKLLVERHADRNYLVIVPTDD